MLAEQSTTSPSGRSRRSGGLTPGSTASASTAAVSIASQRQMTMYQLQWVIDHNLPQPKMAVQVMAPLSPSRSPPRASRFSHDEVSPKRETVEEALEQRARERLERMNRSPPGLAKVSESNLSRGEAREVSPQRESVEEAVDQHKQQRLERRRQRSSKPGLDTLFDDQPPAGDASAAADECESPNTSAVAAAVHAAYSMTYHQRSAEDLFLAAGEMDEEQGEIFVVDAGKTLLLLMAQVLYHDPEQATYKRIAALRSYLKALPNSATGDRYSFDQFVSLYNQYCTVYY